MGARAEVRALHRLPAELKSSTASIGASCGQSRPTLASLESIMEKTRRVARDAAADPRWASVLARDPAADGQFVYAVKTTGVYCRPSSTSRVPKPENVEFFPSAKAAEAAGYRPSKRAASDRTAVAGQPASLVA